MGENKFRKPFTPEGIGNNIDVPKTYRNFRDRYSDMDEYLRNEFDVTEDRVRHWREIYLEKE